MQLEHIRNAKDNEARTEPGSLGQMKCPRTKVGTTVTTSNSFCSPNSCSAFSANVLAIT